MLLTKRRLLLAATAATLARPAIAQALPVVRVTHFGGPYAALQGILAAPFEAARLGRVVYETENSVSATAKLQSQRDNPPFDVAMLSRGISLRAGAAGLVTPLPAGALPSVSGLVEGAMAPGNVGVAMLLDSMGIMYDRTKVSAPITSWLDLWRADLRGQVAMPSASLPIYLTLMAVAKAVAGDTTKPESFDAAFARLRDIRQNTRVFYSDPVQASQMMERGEIAAAVQFTGRMPPVIRARPDVQLATLKEGVPSVPYDLCLVANGRNREAALAYIDFALGQERQSALGAALLVTPAHRQASVPAESQRMMADPAGIWFPDEALAAQRAADWSRRWQREVQS